MAQRSVLKHIRAEEDWPLPDEFAFPFLVDAINRALWVFRADLAVVTRTEDLTSYRIPRDSEAMKERRVAQARAIGPALTAIDRLISRYLRLTIEADWPNETPTEQSWGEYLIDLMMETVDHGGGALSVRVGGNTYGEKFMFACIALRQCDRCIDAALAGNVQAVGNFMWDIHLLLSEINLEDEREEERELATVRAVNLNRKRHAKRDADRAVVTEQWYKTRSNFPSAAAAGRHFAEKLAEQGREYEPNTVRDWIRAHAKAAGVKLR